MKKISLPGRTILAVTAFAMTLPLATSLTHPAEAAPARPSVAASTVVNWPYPSGQSMGFTYMERYSPPGVPACGGASAKTVGASLGALPTMTFDAAHGWCTYAIKPASVKSVAVNAGVVPQTSSSMFLAGMAMQNGSRTLSGIGTRAFFQDQGGSLGLGAISGNAGVWVYVNAPTWAVRYQTAVMLAQSMLALETKLKLPSVISPGFARPPIRMPATKGTGTIVVRPQSVCGKAIPNLQLRLWVPALGEPWADMMSVAPGATTFKNVPAGTYEGYIAWGMKDTIADGEDADKHYSLTVSAGKTTTWTTVKSLAGCAPQTPSPSPTPSLSKSQQVIVTGLVTDTTGHPVPGATLVLPVDGQNAYAQDTAVTGKDGRYTLKVSVGKRTLYLYGALPGYVVANNQTPLPVNAPAGTTTTVDYLGYFARR